MYRGPGSYFPSNLQRGCGGVQAHIRSYPYKCEDNAYASTWKGNRLGSVVGCTLIRNCVAKSVAAESLLSLWSEISTPLSSRFRQTKNGEGVFWRTALFSAETPVPSLQRFYGTCP